MYNFEISRIKKHYKDKITIKESKKEEQAKIGGKNISSKENMWAREQK